MPGAYTYGAERSQVSRDSAAQFIEFLDWLIAHGETQWIGMAQQARQRIDVELVEYARPVVLLGPKHKQDWFQLGIEEAPPKYVQIERLIRLCNYAFDDLGRVTSAIPEEEWMLPLCGGRVVEAVCTDLLNYESLSIRRLRRIMETLGLKSHNTEIELGLSAYLQTFQERKGFDSGGTDDVGLQRWSWKQEALRHVIDDFVRLLSAVKEIPATGENAEVWTLRKILLILLWAIRMTIGTLKRRSAPNDVVDHPLSFDQYLEYLDYNRILSEQHAAFWVTTAIEMMRLVGNSNDARFNQLSDELLGYFADSAANEDTVPLAIHEEIRGLYGNRLYQQKDEIGLKYQCLDALCWPKSRIEHDPVYFIPDIMTALELIVQIHGNGQVLVSLLKTKIKDQLNRE